MVMQARSGVSSEIRSQIMKGLLTMTYKEIGLWMVSPCYGNFWLSSRSLGGSKADVAVVLSSRCHTV